MIETTMHELLVRPGKVVNLVAPSDIVWPFRETWMYLDC